MNSTAFTPINTVWTKNAQCRLNSSQLSHEPTKIVPALFGYRRVQCTEKLVHPALKWVHFFNVPKNWYIRHSNGYIRHNVPKNWYIRHSNWYIRHSNWYIRHSNRYNRVQKESTGSAKPGKSLFRKPYINKEEILNKKKKEKKRIRQN
jgi:hypothetical protein